MWPTVVKVGHQTALEQVSWQSGPFKLTDSSMITTYPSL